MMQTSPLSAEKHGKLRLVEQTDFSDHREENLVPVVFQEFSALATEFPLVFVRNKKTGDFMPSALMGLDKGVNLYCQTTSWRPTFIPTSFTLAPLMVARLGSKAEDSEIVIDEHSPLLSETTGESLFDTDGEPTKCLETKIDNVVKITGQSLQAVEICRYLAENKFLISRTLKLQHSDKSRRYEIEGVFVVDEQMLKNVPDKKFQELRDRGLLAMIYAHLVSLQQVHKLTRMQHQFDLKELNS